MAMEYRHAFDERVAEIEDDINRATKGNIHGVKPHGMRKGDPVFCIRQEVDLVNVERVKFSGLVDKTPMLKSSYLNGGHRTCVRGKLTTSDVEAFLVFCERDSE